MGWISNNSNLDDIGMSMDHRQPFQAAASFKETPLYRSARYVIPVLSSGSILPVRKENSLLRSWMIILSFTAAHGVAMAVEVVEGANDIADALQISADFIPGYECLANLHASDLVEYTKDIHE